jgi:hypothetical protein
MPGLCGDFISLPRVMARVWVLVNYLLWAFSGGNSAWSYKREMGFVLQHPSNQSLLFSVYPSAMVTIKIALWASNVVGPSPEKLRMCFTEFAAEYDIDGDTKSCIGSTEFTIYMSTSGTHLMGLSLESGTNTVLDEQWTVVDVVDEQWMTNDIKDGSRARSLERWTPPATSIDYLFYRNSQTSESGITNGVSEYTVLASTRGGVDSSTATMQNSTFKQLKRRVALFARIAPNFVPSDRFYDWLCDHATFTAAGVDLEVVAPEPGKLSSTIAVLHQI